jgi:membrane protease YdiL (CAAX protease family)
MMLGILIQLLISWLLVKWLLKENLDFLGWQPRVSRIADFFLFLIVSMLCAVSYYWMRMYFGKEQWELSPAFSWKLVWEGIRWNMNSVLYEELIFRGALFYILIRKLNSRYALIISAVAFGIYHWFSYGILGQIPAMLQVFVITGLAGLVYGYGYLKTNSLYATIAMHFGWNFVRGFLFSEGSIGKGVWVHAAATPSVTVSSLVYFIVVNGPTIAFLLINTLLLWLRRKAVQTGR